MSTQQSVNHLDALRDWYDDLQDARFADDSCKEAWQVIGATLQLSRVIAEDMTRVKDPDIPDPKNPFIIEEDDAFETFKSLVWRNVLRGSDVLAKHGCDGQAGWKAAVESLPEPDEVNSWGHAYGVINGAYDGYQASLPGRYRDEIIGDDGNGGGRQKGELRSEDWAQVRCAVGRDGQQAASELEGVMAEENVDGFSIAYNPDDQSYTACAVITGFAREDEDPTEGLERFSR